MESTGLLTEADRRHVVGVVVRALGLDEASPAPTSGWQSREGSGAKGKIGAVSDNNPEDRELGFEDTTMFRDVATGPSYLSQDSPEITFATMKLCATTSRPVVQDLQRSCRYLIGRGRVGCVFGVASTNEIAETPNAVAKGKRERQGQARATEPADPAWWPAESRSPMAGRTAEAMGAATGDWEGHTQEQRKRQGQEWKEGEGPHLEELAT